MNISTVACSCTSITISQIIASFKSYTPLQNALFLCHPFHCSYGHVNLQVHNNKKEIVFSCTKILMVKGIAGPSLYRVYTDSWIHKVGLQVELGVYQNNFIVVP